MARFDMTPSTNSFSLFDLWVVCKKQRTALFVTMSIILTLAVAYAILKTPVYRSDLVVLPSEGIAANEFGALPAGLSGIAALAGLRSSDAGPVKALATLESGAFLERFIQSNGLMPHLYADLWDSQTDTWSDDVDRVEIPTLSQASQLFKECCLSISENTTNGLITISVEWRDPEFAALWANKLIADLNAELQIREINEAESMIAFLQQELEKTNIVGLQQAIFGLIEQQVQRKTFARVRSDFAYQIIDPAVSSEPRDYVRPNRPIILATGLLGGIFMGIMVALLRNHIHFLFEAAQTPSANS
jgi:uncharacterized protein involved in exopolysaccharide biosynthesis